MLESATTTTARPVGVQSATTLWQGAVLTAIAAVLFPRLNAVVHDGQAFWQLDTEAAILIPVIVVVTLALFASVGRWAWSHRTADVAVGSAIVSVLGVVAFWVSAPIVFGGLAVTLGWEARRRGAKRALAATVVGAIAVLAGAVIWLVGP
jgi:hypothetical protein